MFGWGALVLDGRWFRLAVRVEDPVRHEAFTRSASVCVMYVGIWEHADVWEYEVAVPVTAGRRGAIVEGMWGVFVEADGRERHARVRSIVVHPISLGDAIAGPFRRLGELYRSSVDRAGGPGGAGATTLSALAGIPSTSTPGLPAPASSPSSPPGPAAVRTTGASALAGLAGAGIALAALSTALAYIGGRFVAATASVGGWLTGLPVFAALHTTGSSTVGLAAYPVAVVIVLACTVALPMVAYLLPVCVGAWMKLRRRDLGSLLIGSGWSVNTRLYLTRDLAGLFTQLPKVPAALRGARRT